MTENERPVKVNVPQTPDSFDEDEDGNGSSDSNGTSGSSESGGTGSGSNQPRMTHRRGSEGDNVGSGTASDEAPGMWRDGERRKREREELEQMIVELYAAAAMLDDDELRDLAADFIRNPKSLTDAEIQRLIEAGIADECTVHELCHGDHDRKKEELSQLLRRIRKAVEAQEAIVIPDDEPQVEDGFEFGA